MSYASGEAVISRLVVQRERWPGGPESRGNSLVLPDQVVLPDQPVLRLSHTNREIFSSIAVSSTSSCSEEIVPSGLQGKVVALSERGAPIIESSVLRLKGGLGVGKQVAGMLAFWPDGSVVRRPMIPPGAILVVPGTLSFMLLRQSCASGVAGIVAGSIALRDLEGFLRYDLVKLFVSDEAASILVTRSPITLLFTEGIGQARMPEYLTNYLQRLQGSVALLSGATSWRHGIVPEMLISRPDHLDKDVNWPLPAKETALYHGVRVRLLRGEYRGMIGEVIHLYVYEHTFSSGIRARAVLVRLENGECITLPLTDIERFA